MTNKERVIADFVKVLKILNTSELAHVFDNIYCINFCCQHCIYGDNDGNCKVEIENCYDGIKKWLERGIK